MLSLELPDACELVVVNVNAKRMSALTRMSRYKNWIVIIVVNCMVKRHVLAADQA